MVRSCFIETLAEAWRARIKGEEWRAYWNCRGRGRSEFQARLWDLVFGW